ncbi:hypothetical protein FHETE_10800, partial [Fusarium heterosporum]
VAEAEPVDETAAVKGKSGEEAPATQEEPEESSGPADIKSEEEAVPPEDKQPDAPVAPEDEPNDDAKLIEASPVPAAATEDESAQTPDTTTHEESKEIVATEEALATEIADAPEKPTAGEPVPVPAEDTPSTDDKPVDNPKSNEDEVKEAAQEADVLEEEKPTEEAKAPETEAATVKSLEESADTPAEAEKEDDKTNKASAEEEAKAKEAEESKDTLGPIPTSKRPAKKGEEHGLLQDTPFDFTQDFGVSPELNEGTDNGVTQLLSKDTQGHQEAQLYKDEDEESTELETFTQNLSQPSVAEASDDQNNQNVAETTMPGLQEPSSGQSANVAAVESISIPLESKTEILDDAQLRQMDLSQNLNQNLDLVQDPEDPPATETQHSTKISIPGTPLGQGMGDQSARAVHESTTEEPVNDDLQHTTTIHSQPRPQPQPQQETETETGIEIETRASDSRPTFDTHHGHDKPESMESDMPIAVARGPASEAFAASTISSDNDSETFAPLHTAAEEPQRPLDSNDSINHTQVESEQSSPGLLQAIATPGAASHEPKMLEIDFDNVLQISRELPQEPQIEPVSLHEQDEDSDLSEEESIEDDESILEEHLKQPATSSPALSPESSEVAKPTETRNNNMTSSDNPHSENLGSTEETTIGDFGRSDAISRVSSSDGFVGDESELAHRPSSPTESVPADTHQKDSDTDDDTDDGTDDGTDGGTDDGLGDASQQKVVSRSPSAHQTSDLGTNRHGTQKDDIASEIDEPAAVINPGSDLNLEEAVGETNKIDRSPSEDESDDEHSKVDSEVDSEDDPKLRPVIAHGSLSNKPSVEKDPNPPGSVLSAVVVEDASDSDEGDSESEHISPNLTIKDVDAHQDGLPVERPALAIPDHIDDAHQSDVDQAPRIESTSSPEPESSSLLGIAEARRGSESSDEEPLAPSELVEQTPAIVRKTEPSGDEDHAVAQADKMDLSDSASTVSVASDTEEKSLVQAQTRTCSPSSGLLDTATEADLQDYLVTASSAVAPETPVSHHISTSSSPESTIGKDPEALLALHEPDELHDADTESEAEAMNTEASSQPFPPQQDASHQDNDNSDSTSDDQSELSGPPAVVLLDAQPVNNFPTSQTLVTPGAARDSMAAPDAPVFLKNDLDDKSTDAFGPQPIEESRFIAEPADEKLDRKVPDTPTSDDESDDDIPTSREISPIGIGRISVPHKVESVAGETQSTIQALSQTEDDPEEAQTARDDKFQELSAIGVPAVPSEVTRASGDEHQDLEDSSSDEDEQTKNYDAAESSRDKSLPPLERPQQYVSDHRLSEVKTPDTDDTLGSEPKPVQAAGVKPMGLVRPDVKVVDIPSRGKGKAAADVPETPKRARSTSRSARPSRAEPPRTFLTQQQRPRRSLRVRPVTEVYTKDPIFIPVASRPNDAKPMQRPQAPRAESEPVKVPARPQLGHRSQETEGESSKVAMSDTAPRSRSFQADGELPRAPARHDLRHSGVAVEDGLRDATYRAPPPAGSSTGAEADFDAQRSPSPGIVIPDADMIDLQRARTLRRTRKTSIQRAEDTLAAAVVIYATAEALSPPGSPSPFDQYRDRDLPNMGHEMYTEPSDYNFPVVSTPRESFEDDYEDFHKSNADLFADDRSRESDSSRSDRDKDGRRRRRYSHRSDGSREEARERRYRDDGERRVHRSRTDDDGRRHQQSQSHREDESRYSRHRDSSSGGVDVRPKSSRGSEEPRTRGYRRDEDMRTRESRKAEEPALRGLPQEDEGRERRRRSSGAHASRRHRSDTVESAAPPGTPPRTPRRDSGFSADNSSGSSGRRRRTREEQADHDKRKAERTERRAREERDTRREPSRYREPVPESKGKEPAREPEPEPELQPEPEPDRRHRRSRRQSHSDRPRYEELRDHPREEPPTPERKPFAAKNSEVVSGGTPPPREEPAIAEPIKERTREAPLEGSPKRSSTRHRRTQPSTDEQRPRASRPPRDEPAPEPPRDRNRDRDGDRHREKNRDKDRTRDEEPKTRPTKHVRMDTEDTRRKARHEERRRAQFKDEDKKPSGIKGAFKKLFSKS